MIVAKDWEGWGGQTGGGSERLTWEWYFQVTLLGEEIDRDIRDGGES